MLATQTKTKVAPYGTWDSPISVASVAARTVLISYVFVDPITHQVYHIERRPTDRGRSIIVHTASATDLFEPGSRWDARSTVHEYGGGAAEAYDGVLYFNHVGDGRLYAFRVVVKAPDDGVYSTSHIHCTAESPRAITPADAGKRYASPTPHPTEGHLLVAVLEDHTRGDDPMTVVNMIVCIDTRTSAVYPLITGADFYAAPGFSPDGTKLTWQAWNHPDMPWTGTAIWVADVTCLAGDPEVGPPMRATRCTRIATSTAPQPTHPGSGISYVSWLDDDALLFLAEASGWRNPWVYSLSLRNAKPVLGVPIQEDFAPVYKLLGASYYAPLAFSQADQDPSCDDRREMLFVAYRGGRSVLYIVDLACRGRADPVELECPFIDVSCVRCIGPSSKKGSAEVVFIAFSADAQSTVMFCTITRLYDKYRASFSAAQSPLPEDLVAHLSLPCPMTLEDKDGPLHIVHYAPSNPAFVAPDGERPPCIVNVHGGPTAAALQSLDWTKQWYTSRGWAWLDVNYRGSSLYGRKYTNRLDGQWGMLDVLDCLYASHVLSAPPYTLIDPARCVIRGVSAGGYTVLSYATSTYLSSGLAQADNSFSFRAGASHYGIGDPAALARGSHKLESHYIFQMMGGRPEDPGMAEVYRRRSPVLHAGAIAMPLLMLHGLADRVVPPEQSQGMVDAIAARGAADRVRFKTYEGEGHGFGRAETRMSALEEEATWFARWLGIAIRF